MTPSPPDRPPRSALRTALALLVLAAAASPGTAELRREAAGQEGVFELTSLNRRYQQLAPDMVPVEQGAVTVRLSSPRHQLDLLSNRLVLTPRADGSYDATLELEFAGRGTLVADFDVSGVTSRFEDELVVPQQRRQLAARVRIARSDEGYLVTPQELPATFEVAIHSRVGSQLVAACNQLAVLGLGVVDCRSLNRAFSRVAVPMPEAGETYLVERARLGEEDRRRLDAFLSARGEAGPGP